MRIPPKTEIVLDGRVFYLRVESGKSPIEDYWRWLDSNNSFPTATQETRLRLVFLEEHAPTIFEALNNAERELFVRVLRSMKATEEQLYRIGVIQLPEEDAAMIDAAQYFRDTPPAGWGITNCFHIASVFFEHNPPDPLLCTFSIVGDGPFTLQQLCDFFSPFDEAIPGYEDASHCVILGRNGLDFDEINELIEQHRGTSLRFYSQEMLLSVLAGLPDPFDEPNRLLRYKLLMAFKAGHPGLEYVDRGWRGWVEFGHCEPNFGSTKSTENPKFVDQSPLHLMGYSVGKNGKSLIERQSILVRAFTGPIPAVQSSEYMATWGNPGTAERLQRIAIHISSNIDRNQFRGASFASAREDWQQDLEWLRKTFYVGSFNFSWPEAMA